MIPHKSVFPCHSDLAFFNSKRTPRWAHRFAPNRDLGVPQIDLVINAHAGLRPTSGEVAAHNLLAILRSMERRGLNIGHELARIAQYPECAIHPEKRAAFARKWARRLGVDVPEEGTLVFVAQFRSAQ